MSSSGNDLSVGMVATRISIHIYTYIRTYIYIYISDTHAPWLV